VQSNKETKVSEMPPALAGGISILLQSIKPLSLCCFAPLSLKKKKIRF
jgi:hypothetical protein